MTPSPRYTVTISRQQSGTVRRLVVSRLALVALGVSTFAFFAVAGRLV